MPSFRTALAMEKEEWKPFRNALSKSDRKKFDATNVIMSLRLPLLNSLVLIFCISIRK